MRSALFAILFTVVCALGTSAMPSNVQAQDARIYVDLGDVSFSYGRPYHRYDRTPLYISYDRYDRPRYYRYAPRRALRANYYDPYYDGRVIVRPRVVYRDRNYRDSRYGYRDRYWVDRYGRRHYYRH